MHYGLTWELRIPTVFQRSLKSPSTALAAGESLQLELARGLFKGLAIAIYAMNLIQPDSGDAL